jgi:hypothetical protein
LWASIHIVVSQSFELKIKIVFFVGRLRDICALRKKVPKLSTVTKNKQKINYNKILKILVFIIFYKCINFIHEVARATGCQNFHHFYASRQPCCQHRNKYVSFFSNFNLIYLTTHPFSLPSLPPSFFSSFPSRPNFFLLPRYYKVSSRKWTHNA